TYNTVNSKVTIVSKPLYGSISKGWTGEADISDIFNNTTALLPWEIDYQSLTAGSWVNGGRDFSYNMGAGTGSGAKVTTATSASTAEVPGFLPFIPLADGGG